MPDDAVLDNVGPRLRALRHERAATLADLSETTGISVSTLSRLESGQRRPTLELLLPLARAHGVSLDDLVDGQPPDDPRVHRRPFDRGGLTLPALTLQAAGLLAHKHVLPPRWPTGPGAPNRQAGLPW